MYDKETIKALLGSLALILVGRDPHDHIPNFLTLFLRELALINDATSYVQTALATSVAIDVTSGIFSAIIRLREETRRDIQVRSIVRVAGFSHNGYMNLKIERIVASESGTGIMVSITPDGNLHAEFPPIVLSKFVQRGNQLFTVSLASLDNRATAVNYRRGHAPLIQKGTTIDVKAFSHDLVLKDLDLMVIPGYYKKTS